MQKFGQERRDAMSPGVGDEDVLVDVRRLEDRPGTGGAVRKIAQRCGGQQQGGLRSTEIV